MQNLLSSSPIDATSAPDWSTPARATPTGNETYASGISWAAVIGGAVVAAALALVLLILGAGLGLSAVSPWSKSGASATALGVGAIVWLIVIQIIASGMGGYLAGRLRTKWVRVHTDEVFFRDTAHGFLVWALGVIITVSLLTSVASSLVSGGAQLGAGALSAAAGGATAVASRTQTSTSNPGAYFIDMLLRSDHPGTQASEASVHAEIGRIVATGVAKGTLAPADKTYLAQVVAARTGLSQADAEKRVTEVITQAKTAATHAATAARAAADTARKAAAYLSLWIFVSLLIGAFCASYAATIGGRQRDNVVV
jgi:hypothetical protein